MCYPVPEDEQWHGDQEADMDGEVVEQGLLAAATFSRDTGDRAAVVKYAELLAMQALWDAAAQQILQDLRSRTNGGG